MDAPQTHTITVPDSFGGADHGVAVWDAGADQFAARLRKVFKERRKWAKREGVHCYRVYDADLLDFSVAIDFYEGAGPAAGERFAVVAEYRPPKSVDPVKAAHRFEDACAIAGVVLGVPRAHLFARERRRDKGGSQYVPQASRRAIAYTEEGGYLFELDFGGYLDTGLFLDHRLARLLVGRLAAGKRFLNLFAYTGSATVHAAGGHARTTTTVDLSQTYLDRARRNMAMNDFTGPAHTFVRADVTDWIVREGRSGRLYDLVFCDPPTFSNSKAMGQRTWDVQRDHVKLLTAIEALLAPAGTIVFSCNLRGFKLDAGGLARAGLGAQDISKASIPHDFERNDRIHHCYIVTRTADRKDASHDR